MSKPLEALTLLPLTRAAPDHRMFVDYDEEADVLYVSFSDPPETPAFSREDDLGVITRSAADGRILGYTYLNATELLARQAA